MSAERTNPPPTDIIAAMMGWSIASLAAPLTRAWRLFAIETTNTRRRRPQDDVRTVVLILAN
jgi:hypothetical protein